MKRIIALALVLCTGISLFTHACAENAPFRFVTNAMNLVEDWLEEHHPDIKYENLYDTADSWRTGEAHTGRVLDALQSGDGPDLLMLESSLCDFEKVLKSGLVEDLSGHQGIRAALSQMYEPFQSFVTGENGGMYGVLYGVNGLGMHVIPAAWEAAGLNAADAPQSYEELLDFAGRWAERVEAGEVGNIRLNALRSCGYLMDDQRYTLWLTDLLLDSWIMRHQAAGEALVFNTPEFIALAERARETGRALAEAEEKPAADSLSLYDELFNGGTGYGGPEDLYTNAFPMRLTADESARIKAYGFLFVVRKESPYADIAMEFIASQTHKTGEGRRNSRLYKDIPDGQYTPPEGMDGYVLTREWQEHYRPEWLYFCTNPIHTTDAYSKQEKLRSQFALGELTAEAFAAGLDEICEAQ